jgi:effector-binding domain-containing protein
MIETPRIVRTEQQFTAVIHLTIPRSEIRNVMGPGIADLMATVSAQGLAPAGPFFSHHFRMDPELFDFEIGVPVHEPISAAGRVRPGQRPPTTVARTIYQGPYEGLATAWGALGRWITAQGHTPAEDFFESYVTGPETTPDAAEWRTELSRPLTHVKR